MTMVKVLMQFWDLEERCVRNPGDEFVATEERALEIQGKLPDYVELYDPDVDAGDGVAVRGDTDYQDLKVTQLKELCAERGIEVPKGAKKPDLIALLGE